MAKRKLQTEAARERLRDIEYDESLLDRVKYKLDLKLIREGGSITTREEFVAILQGLEQGNRAGES